MRKMLVPAILAASLGLAGAAFAAAATTTVGTIKAMDAKAHTLSLDNGMTYSLPTNLKVPDLKVGQKVSVTWDKVGTKDQASAVTIVKS
tara:strand:+ start:274 stop:540 length:267 start_codon:yes stop_codon:yes gene_type:complete